MCRRVQPDGAMLVYRDLADRADHDARVLDVGTKDGRHLADVAGRVVALDLDVRPGVESVEFVAGDGTRLPFPAGTFDYVVCNQVLEHVEAKDRLVAELSRVLAPDGVLLVSFPNRLFPVDPHGFPPGFPLLPRAVALRLSKRRSREAFEYYRDHVFYLSAPGGRRLLSRHFGSVEYATLEYVRRFPEVYGNSPAGRLLLRIRPLLRALERLPGGARLFEAAFGYAAYRCRPDAADS